MQTILKSQMAAKHDAIINVSLLISLFWCCTHTKTSNAKLLFAILAGEGGNEKFFPWHVEAKEPHRINMPCFQSYRKAHNER